MLSPSTKTRLLGLFGYPVEHSLSAAMHNQAFAHLGMDCLYLPFSVPPADLKAAVAGIRVLNLLGVNITIPHKEVVMDCLDEVTAEARGAGAVNTIVNRNGRLIGHNTDGTGFVRSMREMTGITPEGKTVVLVGAGGAARGVGVALGKSGARRIFIANRTKERALQVARDIQEHSGVWAGVADLTPEGLKPVLAQAQILIHASPVGMFPRQAEPPLVPEELLTQDLLVCDLVYRPSETALIKAARQRGCAVLPGWGMLVYQGAAAFELWFGGPAPVEVMRQAVLESLTLENA